MKPSHRVSCSAQRAMPFSLRVTSRSSKVSSASSVRQLSVENRVRGRPLEERFSMRGGGVGVDVSVGADGDVIVVGGVVAGDVIVLMVMVWMMVWER